ncbi:MAG: hypothetical protein GY799_26660 [Desulfobulbaceae bacterium]|nr:hypothetical protein [Desulfobulbaceae bacterium]
MKRTAYFLVPLFFLLSVCSLFLLTTESGLVFIQSNVNRFGGGAVSIGQVRGSLLSDFTLSNIRLVSADADIDVQQLEYSWRPRNLLKAEFNIAQLMVTGVEIALKDDPEPPPTDDVVQLPAALLPLTILVESLVLNKLEIVNSDGEDLFIVDRATASIETNADRLTINAFDLQGPEIGLTLHGNIEVQQEWVLDILGGWRLAGFEFHPMTGTFSVKGPLGNPHLEVGGHSSASIRVVADLVDLLDKPEWTAKLEAKDVDLSTLIVDCPKIELASVTADFAGDLDNYRGRVTADGTWETFKGMHLTSSLTGDFLGIAFQSLLIDLQNSSLEVKDGKIDWKNIFSWDGQLLLKNFDPAVITEELQGRFSAELQSVGDVNDNGVVASFEILNFDGVVGDNKISASGDVFLTETEVKTDGLTIMTFMSTGSIGSIGSIGSGDIAGLAHIEHANFSWAEEPHWSGKIRLEQFDPSWLSPDFFGSVSGELQGKGSLGDKGLEGSLNIKNLSGMLRGNEISGGGEISISGDTLKTTGLALEIGPSKLTLQGQAGDRLALDFSFSSPDIGSILPESKGSILLQGSLKGSRSEPHLDAHVEGAGLSYQENRLVQAQADIQAELKQDGKLTGLLVAEKMTLSGFVVDKGVIKLKGSLAEHELVVDVAGALGELGFTARGAYQDEWRGELSHFQLEAGDSGVWRQEQSVAFKVGRNGVLLEKICLVDGEGTLCLGGDVRLVKELSWAVQAKMTSVPLQWLNRLDLVTVPVSGEINAEIAANGDSRRVLSAKIESNVAAVSLLMNVNETEQVPFSVDDFFLTLDLTDSLLQGNINVRMQDDSQVVLSANVEGAGEFSPPLDSLFLHGNLDLKEFDLALLSAFTGFGVEPSGRVDSSFTLKGTVGQPNLSGDLKVREGGIELPYQGITLEDIVLSIEAGEEAAQVSAQVTSGPGQLTAAGTVQYGATGIEGALNIMGDDFLLVNLPEYAIRVKPDLLLTFGNDTGEISGTIDVPYGLIAPEEMSDSVSVSEDVILVSGTEEERTNNLPIKPNLKIRLGDDVRIDGYGLTGKLEGELNVLTQQDNSLAGRGTLTLVDGTFAMYGQKLSIERGRVLFTGGPLDNPGIDVRAQRKVTGKKLGSEIYTVGLDVSGLVQDLQYNLTSDPFMEDTEILSLMIVGQTLADSSSEEGNMLEAAAMMLGTKGSSGFAKDLGSFMSLDDLHFEGSSTRENMALVVGKRLTEDLYIGYDLNMFSQLSKFRVRYDLTRGFSVETRSSAESTGADLLYSFER